MIILCTLCILPRRLLAVKPPMCAGCKAEVMARNPTRVKGQKHRWLWEQTTKSGECVSVDQTESRTPGFIGVMREFICKERYTCAPICVDHFSNLTYTHLQRSTSLEDTLATFRVFETTITLIMVVLLTRDSSIDWDRIRRSSFAELTHTGRIEKPKNAFGVRKTKEEMYYYMI